jgi:predicted P-loop ATPase
MVINKPQKNITQLNAFIDALFEHTDGYIELRPFSDETGAGIDHSARRWFTQDEFKQKQQQIIDYCRRKRLACCIGLLPRAAQGTGTADSVESGCVVWADLDDKDFKGGRREIISKLERLDPFPSAIVVSGGGLHLYYFLGEDTPAHEIEEANKRLAALSGGDKCHDRARVLRLPYSWHQKNIQRPVQLDFMHYSGADYSILDLLDVWPECAASRSVSIEKIDHTSTAALSQAVQQLMAKNQILSDLWIGIGKATGDQTGSGYDYAVARELLWLGATPEDTADAIAYRVSERGKKKPITYYSRTVGRALADVKRYKEQRAEADRVLDGVDGPSSGDPITADKLIRYPDTHRTKAGEIVNNLHNVVSILTHDPRWAGQIKLNSFKNRIEVDGRSISDQTSTALRLWIYRAYWLTVNKDLMSDAIDHVASTNKYHPVQEYLQSLRWDGTSRLATWLARLMGAEQTPLNSEIGTRWLVQGVARVMSAGSKTDGCLILQGPQGIGKSSALRILSVSPDWYRDSFVDIRTGRDAYSKLAGVWIYEFPELESTRGRDDRSVKAFLTSQVDTYRPAYAKYESEVPRQVVFAGTTNDQEILSDPTGSRRYWIVACTQCAFDKLEAEADQLWAEAMHIYNQWNDPTRWAWELDPAVIQAKNAVNEKYQQQDTWTSFIETWLSCNDELHQTGATVADVMYHALLITPDRQSRAQATRTGSILSSLNWSKKRVSVDGKRAWYWFPPS